MSIYVKIGKKILDNPSLVKPHVKVRTIADIDFEKMKDMGMNKLIFGKDNTLTVD